MVMTSNLNKISFFFSKLTFFILTLFFQSHLSLSSSDPFYGTCKPTQCGDLEISYPFRVIDKQKPYCGYPGFDVSCRNGNLTFIKISGNDYVIQHIWYDNQYFQVTNSAFLDSDGSGSHCWSSIRNLTLEDNVFNFTTNYNEIMLLLNCTDTILKQNQDHLVKCGALAVYGNDPKLKKLAGNCRTVISVPYEGESGSNFTEVLKRGVLLNWTANNCSDCKDSGGQCGFDQSVSEFKCFCSDRPHSSHCHGIPVVVGEDEGMMRSLEPPSAFVLARFICLLILFYCYIY